MKTAANAEVPFHPELSCVGRQAIVDARAHTVGYELLYRRSPHASTAAVTDDVAATATVVLNTMAELGTETVVGRRDMYLNCSAGVLALPLTDLLPARQVVLEILESVPITPELRDRIAALRQAGFRVALDDYMVGDPRASMLEMVDVVKVDLSLVDEQQLPRLVTELSAWRVQLLAEKVEDVQQFQRCAALGFKLFQGYFFCRPTTLSKKTAAPDRIHVMHTLAEIQRPGISIDQAVALIQRDVNISYRLLRCLNSVVFGLRRPVDSVRHALILLGMARVRAWVALMALSTIHGKPHELVRMAMVRAAMCQALADRITGLDRDIMFTIGMFSLLDVLLDTSMDEVLAQLPLGPTVAGALLGKPSKALDVLEAVRAHERGDFQSAALRGLDLAMVSHAWLTAVMWAEHVASFLFEQR